MTKSKRLLDWENEVVLELVQNLIGLISPNMSAVSVEVGPPGEKITVYFALKAESEEDRDTIDEVPTYLAAGLGHFELPIETNIWVGSKWSKGDWPGHKKRMVYGEKSTRGSRRL